MVYSTVLEFLESLAEIILNDNHNALVGIAQRIEEFLVETFQRCNETLPPQHRP